MPGHSRVVYSTLKNTNITGYRSYIQHRLKYISTGHLVPNTDHMYCHYGAPRFRMPSISVNCQCSFNLGEVQGALRQGLQEKPDCL